MKKYLLCLWCMALACMGMAFADDAAIEVPESVRALPATANFCAAINSARTSARKKIKKQLQAQRTKALDEQDFIMAEAYGTVMEDLMQEFGGGAGNFLEGKVWLDGDGHKYVCQNGSWVDLGNGQARKVKVLNPAMILLPDKKEMLVWFDDDNAVFVQTAGLPVYKYEVNVAKLKASKEDTPVPAAKAKAAPAAGGEPAKITRMKETLREQYHNEVAGKIVKARKRYIAELRTSMQTLGKAGKLQEASELQKFVQIIEHTRKLPDLLAIVDANAPVADAKVGTDKRARVSGAYPEYNQNGQQFPKTRVELKGDVLECYGETKLAETWNYKEASPGGQVLAYMKGRARTVVFIHAGYLFRVMSVSASSFKYTLRLHSCKTTSK